MKRYSILAGLWLTIIVAIPRIAQAAPGEHYFNCKNCHLAGLSVTAMGGNNVCLRCHEEIGAYIPTLSADPPPAVDGVTVARRSAGDASNHFGRNVETGSSGKETSHIWGVTDIWQAAGVPQAPSRTNYAGFYGRYNISTGKVTCSRCHNPHGETVIDILDNSTGLPTADLKDNALMLNLDRADEDERNNVTGLPGPDGLPDIDIPDGIPDGDGIPDNPLANPQLLQRDNLNGNIPLTPEGICRACHITFNIPNVPDQNGLITHPMVADYASFQSANSTKYRSPAEIAAISTPSRVSLVKVQKTGTSGVGCTSCHAAHYADSDSSTQDGAITRAGLSDSDGHLLRSDGPLQTNGIRDKSVGNTPQLRSNLCQSCHKYQLHGRDGGTNIIGCLDCHGGHSYNGGSASAYVLKHQTPDAVPWRDKMVNQTPLQVSFNPFTAVGSTRGRWSDNTKGSATGYCEQCHGDVENDTDGVGTLSTKHVAGTLDGCDTCHPHSEPAFSFAKKANAATCGQCHGYPPYLNVRGDVGNDPDGIGPNPPLGTNGGYAYNYVDGGKTYNYLSNSGHFKNETETAHKAHSGKGITGDPGYWYYLGNSNCNVCHGANFGSISGNHRVEGTGTFRDLPFDGIAKTGNLVPSYKTGNPNIWTCSNTYCHSSGGPRTGNGPTRNYSLTVMTPAWDVASGGGHNSILNDSNRCGFCHGNDATDMGTRSNSVPHIKHLNKGFSCNVCHATVAASATALVAGATDGESGGKHVSGSIEVAYPTSGSTLFTALGASTNGVNWDAPGGTCSVYCHDPRNTGLTADWDSPGSVTCGSCHGVTAATLATSGSHRIHIDSSKADISCDACHGANASAGNHAGHLNGVSTFLPAASSCNPCHGIDAGDTGPTWGQSTSTTCASCHSGTTTTSYSKYNNGGAPIPVTAPAKTYAYTAGHNRPTTDGAYPVTGKPAGNKQCSACHLTTIGTGHVDGLGNGDLLVASFSCESCHTAAGSRFGEATVRVKTHDNRDGAYTMQKRADFTKACLACHDPHGTYNGVSENGAMLESVRTTQNAKDVSGNYGGNVVFTALTLTDSFDEADASNLDDVCATCHTTTAHNNRTATGSHGGYEGTNCTTVCHGHNGINGGFMPSGGTNCNDCHGNPPSASDPRPNDPNKIGAHVAHVKVSTHDPSEDKFDCEVCHPGASTFTAAHADGPTPLAAGITNGTCSNACHYSAGDDGSWTDSNGLNCSSCHYWGNPPTRAGNTASILNRENLTPTHNKHFDTSRACTTCHPDNSAETTYGTDGRPHITNHEAWDLNTTNDGAVLTGRANALQDEASVIVTTWDDGTDTCSNAACHNPSGITKSATWGTPNSQNCDFCHSSTNPDATKGTPGSHGPHMGATANFGITPSIACTSCHPNNTLNGHLTGAVELNGGFTYTTSLTDYTSGTFGRCTTTTCHNNGRGTAVQTPVWGTASANCSICHAAPPAMANSRHAEHVANTAIVSASCGSCHLNATATTITASTHIDGTRNVGSQIVDVDLGTGGNQLVAPGGWNGTCTNNCHNVDTTGTWTDAAANKLTCIECHTSGKLAGGAYPNTGLHTGTLTVSANTHDNSFKVTKNEGSPSGTCMTCHPGIDLANDLPATHYAGGAPAPAEATIPATVGYLAGSPPTCGPNGALVNCHDDKGTWKRRWSTTATATNGTQCGNCHGNFDTTWVIGISQRHSSDAQIHGGHTGGVNDCYICHTFGWGATYPDANDAKHRDGSIQLNNGMLFNDDGATVHCTGCHDNKPLGLADGQYSFQDTNSADGADGGLNRWLRVEQAGPPANCNGCHAVTNGLDHDGTNESLAVHDYHTGSPLTSGCGACHPLDSGPGGTLHQNNQLDFGGTYLSLAAYPVTPGVGGNFANTNCSTANGCHDSDNNSWVSDSLATCGDCHAASTKFLYIGSGLSGYPPASNEHAIHIANNAYVGGTPTSDCDDCHGTGASAPGHLARHNDGALDVIAAVAAGSKITQLNPDKSCTNSCHATANGRDWDSATTLVCVDCHLFGSSYIGEATKPARTAPNGLHKATVATAHDDNFGSGGTCTSCHTSINLASQVDTHVNGLTTDPNTTYGLFANYRTANGDCFASCHADAGDWRRKWLGVTDAKPLETDAATAAVCGNCHGSFAQGWRFVNEGGASSTDHTDPEQVDNTGDQMNTAGHQTCTKCHGWLVAAYDSANKHQNNSLTMNADLGYTDVTGGCATNCHAGKTLTMQTNSGFTTETAAYGGVGCGGCHAAGGMPPVSGSHAAHAADNDTDYTECEACHGNDNGGSWATGSGGAHNMGSVTFAGTVTYSGGATGTCSTTNCHSKSTEVATWGTPASLGCDECHNATATVVANNAGRTLSNSHNTHFAKGKTCSQCHSVPVDRGHITGGGANDGAVLTGRANAAQDEALVTMTAASINAGNSCSGTTGISLGCHNTKTTPAWGTTGIVCTACHTAGGAAAGDPNSGLHAITPTISSTKHDGTLAGGNCINCHSATSPSSLHQNGSVQNSSAATFTFHSNVTSYSAAGCAATCHADAGDWARKWSTSAANSDGSECANCHGGIGVGYAGAAWNTGIVPDHTANWDGDASADNPEVMTKHSVCKSCHGFNGAADKDDNYLLTMHRNNQITMNGGTNYNATNWGCDNAGCHGTAAAAHALADSGWTVELGAFAAGGSCYSCHGDGASQTWPDGTTYPDRAGAHIQHIPEIAAKMTGGDTLANRNATCIYCHPGGAHSGDQSASPADVSMTDADNSGSAELNTGTKMIKLILNAGNPVDDPNGFWRSTPGTCSTVACHAGAPYTPHWYADTVPPGNVTLTATLGPVPRSIKLTWVAPGNDGDLDGTAYKYDIRWGDSSLVANDFISTTNHVKGIPTVKRRLDEQEAIIHGVAPGIEYFFSLRTYDENVISDPATTIYGISNTASYTTPSAGPVPNPSLDNVAPVLTGSPQWYGLDSAKALDDGSIKLSWTRAEDHSMPITYEVFWSQGAINWTTPQASTKDTSFRVTGLTIDTTYNFAVRAKDFFNNTDTNTVTLQAIPQGLNAVPKSSLSYYANGTATTNIPMLATEHTADGTTTTLPAVFIGPTTFSSVTDIITSGFSVNVVNSNVPTTLRAELIYITGASTPNSFNSATAAQTQLFATDVTVAKRATRLVTFKFNGATRRINAAMAALPVKLGVRVSVSTGAVTSIGWGPTSKGGIFSFAAQPINTSPTTPTVTASPSGANVNIFWAAATDTADGVADTVHYDVYGDDGVTLPGTFPYLIASGLTVNATVGAPLVWDTQAAGIALGTQNSTVRVRVEAGDVVSGKVLSHTPSTSGNLTVNNSGDNVAPGTITNFNAETRPKQGSVYLSWTAPGDDGTNNGRALYYDIRYDTRQIVESGGNGTTTVNFANVPITGQAVSEPYPDFGGNGQGYEVLGLTDGNYYFAIKAFDKGGKSSPLAVTAATQPAGPKCGICHSTPPDEPTTKGNHAKHGYTMKDCGNCHGNSAANFTTDHQDGAIKLGWKTDTPATAIPWLSGYKYQQTSPVAGTVDIYIDGDGSGGFNPLGDNIDDGTCMSWSNQQVSGCHGPATSALWDADPGNTLVCSSCHGVPLRPLDAWGHSFDDPSDDVKSAPPIDNHGYDGTSALEGERKYVGAHVPHLNYSFRLSKGDSCRMCHGPSRPGSSLHADGHIDVQLDKAAAGPDATWTYGNEDPLPANRTAGTCASLSADSCHPASIANPTGAVNWDSALNFDCIKCHGMGGTIPGHVTDPNATVSDPGGNNNVIPLAERMPGNCTWCHVGGHPKEKKITAITKASPAVVTTENPHNLAGGEKVTIHTQTGMTEINNKTFTATYINATQFSLQGSNSTTYGTFDYGTWIEGNGTGVILISNDSRVGINYLSGGIHLKANIGNRGEAGSEAELCWGCHGPNSISEWGADSGQTNVYTRAGFTNNNYNYGTLYATPNGTGNWVGASWRSGTTGFGYKDGTIRSTHSTDPTGTAALTGTAYNYSNGGVDAVGKIRCSNCHDVHDSTNSPLEADGLNPDGPPYLRGTWKSNPYKEDGAPQQGTSYTAAASGNPGYGYGPVPRANPSTSQQMGGYWIDQNSGYPTAGWTYESSAGLCQLCHGKTVDNLDQLADSGGLWITATNGHANSALGGSGTGAANIFYHGTGGRPGAGGGNVNPNPGAWMGFQIPYTDSDDYGYGPRCGRDAYLNPYAQASVKISALLFAWGNAVDASTPEVGYHSFSCSKCHNPHASRLPKLMITNCLDVALNTWDNNYKVDTTDWPKFNATTSSWGRNRISHLSTAQNCHRYIDVNNDNTPDEKGWNKVTPWGTNNP